MNEIEKAIEHLKTLKKYDSKDNKIHHDLAIKALNRELAKKVYHFLDDDTFITTCCGTEVTNTDYSFCPNCGCELGEVEEVEEA